MRSIIVALSLCIAMPVIAAPDGGTGQAVSPEDAAKIRDGVKAIGQAFGIAPVQTPVQPQKTIADVADKALTMFGGLVASVSNTLEKVAPHIWRIMIRQQYAKAIADVATPFLMFFLAGLYTIVIRRLWTKPSKYENDHSSYTWTDEFTAWIWLTIVVPCIFGVIFFTWSAVVVSDAAKYLINPEYYAVKDILIMVLNPGAM